MIDRSSSTSSMHSRYSTTRSSWRSSSLDPETVSYTTTCSTIARQTSLLESMRETMWMPRREEELVLSCF